MKLTRFRSDWNGVRSEKANHDEPSIDQVNEALKAGKVVDGDKLIFACETVVEVRTRIGNGCGGNTYRDLYSIKF